MKWFKHDSSAHSDTKLKKVRHKYGMVGYGLYWYCVELIAGKIDSKNITFELEDDAETIAIDWGLDQLKVEEMMRYYCELGLFEGQDNTISCLKLAKRLDDTNSKNPEIKKIINGLSQSDILKEISSNSDSLGDAPSNSEDVKADKTRPDKIRIELKEGHPDLNIDAWIQWIEFRRIAKFKKYKTDSAIENLCAYPTEVQAKAIKHSIDNEYQGLFPEKFVNKKPASGSLQDKNQKAVEDALDEDE